VAGLMSVQVRERCDALAAEVRRAVAIVTERAIDRVGELADPATPVRTGTLLHSRRKEWDAGSLTGGQFWDAPYAAYVNFGTSRMAARPFATQAAAQARKEYLEQMADLHRYLG
jgi:HK97 gp10 family phage protein